MPATSNAIVSQGCFAPWWSHPPAQTNKIPRPTIAMWKDEHQNHVGGSSEQRLELEPKSHPRIANGGSSEASPKMEQPPEHEIQQLSGNKSIFFPIGCPAASV